MKALLAEAKKRLLNRATLAAVAAFLIGKAITLGYIPNELGDGALSTINYVLDVLVFAGILNNAGLGKGFKDSK
jgi:hypothetical protein